MRTNNKYEKLYRNDPNVCGLPLLEFVEFFDTYSRRNASILDLGCGQGRDALFIARKGHRVLGVDLSQTGISQMLNDAGRDNLKIMGVVADISEFEPSGEYDVVLLDRVLHMLNNDFDRASVLEQVCLHTKVGGFVLIADTPKQRRFLRSFFDKRHTEWRQDRRKRDILFVQKIPL